MRRTICEFRSTDLAASDGFQGRILLWSSSDLPCHEQCVEFPGEVAA